MMPTRAFWWERDDVIILNAYCICRFNDENLSMICSMLGLSHCVHVSLEKFVAIDGVLLYLLRISCSLIMFYSTGCLLDLES
jgi:hypothetical protein